MKLVLLALSVAAALALSTGGASAQDRCPNKIDCPVEDNPVGKVCFYTGLDYSNRFFCESGSRTVSSIRDSWKHKIKSIEVFYGASAWICNEEDRQGDCQHIDRSVRELSPDLFDKLYSYRTQDY